MMSWYGRGATIMSQTNNVTPVKKHDINSNILLLHAPTVLYRVLSLGHSSPADWHYLDHLESPCQVFIQSLPSFPLVHRHFTARSGHSNLSGSKYIIHPRIFVFVFWLLYSWFLSNTIWFIFIYTTVSPGIIMTSNHNSLTIMHKQFMTRDKTNPYKM